jgi:hypothetical protein
MGQAGEHALGLLKNAPVARKVLVGTFNKPAGRDSLIPSAHADELLKPITLGCKTKVAKIVGISIAALQRLVSLGGVPTVSRACSFQNENVTEALAVVAKQDVEQSLVKNDDSLNVLMQTVWPPACSADLGKCSQSSG